MRFRIDSCNLHPFNNQLKSKEEMRKILALAGLVASSMMSMNVQAQDTAFITPAVITGLVTLNGCNAADSVIVSYGFINHGPHTLQTTDTFAFVDFTNESDDASDGVWTYQPTAPVAPGDTFALDFNTFYTGIGTSLPINWLVDANTGSVVYPPFANGNYYAAIQWLGFISSNGTSLDFRTDLISNNQDTTSAYADSTIGLVPFTLNCPTTGIHNTVKTEVALNVYPNPATSQVTLAAEFGAATKAVILVTDVAGRIVKIKDLGKQSAGSKSFQVDISSLRAGMYYIKLETETTRSATKFIKN